MADRKIWNGSSWDTIGGGGGGGGITSGSFAIDLANGYWTARENYVSGAWGSTFVAAGGSYSDVVSHLNPDAAVGSGFWIPHVPIPQGATITDARLRINCQSGSWDDLSCIVKGQNSDSAADFITTTTFASGSRPRTSASVVWEQLDIGGEARTTSPNIASVVEEIVGRALWAWGNPMCLILVPRNAATYTLRFDNGRNVNDWDASQQELFPRFTASWSV